MQCAKCKRPAVPYAISSFPLCAACLPRFDFGQGGYVGFCAVMSAPPTPPPLPSPSYVGFRSPTIYEHYFSAAHVGQAPTPPPLPPASYEGWRTPSAFEQYFLASSSPFGPPPPSPFAAAPAGAAPVAAVVPAPAYAPALHGAPPTSAGAAVHVSPVPHARRHDPRFTIGPVVSVDVETANAAEAAAAEAATAAAAGDEDANAPAPIEPFAPTPRHRMAIFEADFAEPTPRMLAVFADFASAQEAFMTGAEFSATVSAFVAMRRHAGRAGKGSSSLRFSSTRMALLGAHAARPIERLYRDHLDKRAALEPFCGTPLAGVRVLVLGAGPAGLLTAIEASLAGASVLLVDRRDTFSRNNVLHIWPYLVTLLRALGVKVFEPSLGTGEVNHIAIRRLQLALTKVALCAGVRMLPGVDVTALGQFDETLGRWRIEAQPPVPEVCEFDADVIVSCTGVNNVLRGFSYKNVAGTKLAIGITVNFENGRTRRESDLSEVSGVSAIFHQAKFAQLRTEHSIALENFVYYRDETHYFVFTPTKQTLLQAGVLQADGPRALLLRQANVDRAALERFAVHCASSALHVITGVEFPLDVCPLVRAGSRPDVAMFDFTDTWDADHASRIEEAPNGRMILLQSGGDCLLTPFWPRGTGANLAALGAQDNVWAMISAFQDPHQALAVRHAAFTKMRSIQSPSDFRNSISLDPFERYGKLPVHEVSNLYLSAAALEAAATAAAATAAASGTSAATNQ